MNETIEPQEDSGTAGGKKLTPKRIKSRLERTQSGDDPRKSRKKRNKTAHSLLIQIASGQISNAQGAAQAYIDALTPEEVADAAEEASEDAGEE